MRFQILIRSLCVKIVMLEYCDGASAAKVGGNAL